MKLGCREVFFLACAIALIPSASAEGGLQILLPGQLAYWEGMEIVFAAVLDVGGSCGVNSSFEWYSSIDGFIGEGVSVSSENLSVGSHTIELRARDGCGVSYAAKKSISVVGGALSVEIVSPEDEENFMEGREIFFDSHPSGGKPPYSFYWSLADAGISGAKSFYRSFSAGNYSVSVSVRDAAGASAADVLALFVLPEEKYAGDNLTVEIVAPRDGQTVLSGARIRLEAESSNGHAPYEYLWEYDGGPLSGNPAVVSAEGNGSRLIVVSVRDALNRSGRSAAVIELVSRCVVDGVCGVLENRKNCPTDCPSGVRDGFCDGAGDGLCDPDCGGKYSSDSDCRCDRNGICDVGIEDYRSCPTDCPSGIQDGVCDGIVDGICDIDCSGGGDSDCSAVNWGEYLFLAGVFGLLAYAFIQLMRRRGG